MIDLSSTEVGRLARELGVYDIDQGGWEHEERGWEFNVKHLLAELVRARRKNMYDSGLVRGKLAPDAMHHSLRIARWSTNEVIPRVETEQAANEHALLMRAGSRRIGAFGLAEVRLASVAHDLDHQSERKDAENAGRYVILPEASQALMLFALDSAHEFDFDPFESFTNRLDALRERFGIPQPGLPTVSAPQSASWRILFLD